MLFLRLAFHMMKSRTLLPLPRAKLLLTDQSNSPQHWSLPQQDCKTHSQKCACKGTPGLPQEPALEWAAPTRVRAAQPEAVGVALQGTPSPQQLPPSTAGVEDDQEARVTRCGVQAFNPILGTQRQVDL